GPSAARVTSVGGGPVGAGGGPPLQTAQVGQLHFEPFWGLLVAALSGFDAGRVLPLYPFLSLAVAVLFPLALHLGLAPSEDGEGWSRWERACAPAAATLLC